MANNSEQAKPLAPAGYQIRHDHEDQTVIFMSDDTFIRHRRRRRCLVQCGGCITALLLVIVVVIIVIATVYQVKNPSIKLNSITIQPLEQLLNNNTGNDSINLFADVSLKNPNYNSFKYSNTTTCIYYGSVVVGEGHVPPGTAKARRTLRMNVTVGINPEKVLTVPGFRSEVLSSGFLNISSYTRIAGEVKMVNVVRKSVVVKLNCGISYNILSHQVIQNNCQEQD